MVPITKTKATKEEIKWLSPNLHVSYVQLLFHKVLSGYIDDATVIASLFSEVFKHYTNKGRHYHNMRHIYRMCKLWKKYGHKLQNRDAVFLAIIYHDIIYKPKRIDNEEKSAVYFNKIALKNFKVKNSYTHELLPLIKKVFDYILATKHSAKTVDLDNDCKFFLDFDLEVLGSDHLDVYDWYKDGVRQEYKVYPDKIYKSGRKSFIESFLKKEKIYLTEEFRSREKTARNNLQNEIKLYI